MSDKIPLYRSSLNTARHCNEVDIWRQSDLENSRCATAIHNAIDCNFADNHLNTDFMKSIIDEFGFDRVSYILACNIKRAMQDARYSQENKNWSELIAIPDSNLRNEYLINNHPVLINALIDKTRIAFDELNMFSADDCESMAGQELTGKVLILKPSILADEYKSPDNQLFLATAGFGCSPSSLGRSIYGVFLKDNEYTSFYRQDFLGIARDDVLPNWAKSKLETQESESLETVQQKVSVSLKKIMAEDKTFGIGNNGEITYVRFGIYADEDIKASNSDVIPKDALITFANCDKNGSIVFDCDLPVGFKWYAKEIATDAHYILSDTKYEFDTEYQGQDVKVIDIKVNNGEVIKNNLIYGSVKGLKVDRETQEVIKGATFGLFKSDTTEFTEDKAILTAVTDENGIFNFSNIPYGEYLIKEIKPADGYLDIEDVFTVIIKDNEQVVELTALNDKVPELKTTATVNGKKEVIAKGEITIKDTIEYKHLVPNTEYVIKGTLMDKSTGKPFKVKGKEITSTVKFVPDKANGKVEVTFTFDGSAIKKNTELVVFETLSRDNVEIAVHADLKDKGQTVTIVPPTPKTPKTSDNRNLGTWIGLGGVGLGAGVAALLLKLKMKKDEDE